MIRTALPSLLAISLCLAFTKTTLAQTNRFMQPSPRDFGSGYGSSPSTRTYTPSYSRPSVDVETMKRRKQQQGMECLKALMQYFKEAALNDQARVDLHEPDSEWVESLLYISPYGGPFDMVIMNTRDDDVYAFKMDYSTWQRWKAASSAGWFYNNFIRGEDEYSLGSACGL